MANKDLFKQAIAEAKSVREAAIANAKEALEETLTPHLKDLLAAKLQEMEDSQNEEEVVNEVEEEVEEVVAEGDGLEAVKEAEHEEEAEDDSEESEDEAEEEEIEDAGEEEGELEAEEEIDGDEDISKLTVDQFKDMIRDIIAQEVGGDAAADDMDAGDIEGMGDEAPIEEPGLEAEPEMGAEEDEIDLDELIRELESVSEGEDKEEETMEEEVTEEGFTSGGDLGTSLGKDNMLDDVLKSLADKAKKAGKSLVDFLKDIEVGSMSKAMSSESTDLEEALETIETLKKELNEVNILNSKLLYVNKIFKANNLTESQKVNIIAAFDKAETVKEVKLVYETVSDNVVNTKKENVSESKVKGMASKATGTTASKPENQIVLSEAALRMQKLAGIIK